MLTVTHDVRCAEALGDRYIEIEKGKIIQEGSSDEIKKYFSKIK